MPLPDLRQHAPATQRNRDPILEVLRKVLPGSGLVLEIASGTGEHAIHFARGLPHLQWQPSDPSSDARASIAAWSAQSGTSNISAPLDLDASSETWPIERADAVVCINMIHISPWEATEGLMAGAARILGPGAPLYLYGPYRREGHALELSNAAFDESLRQRDSRWGLRALEDVARCAADNGLVLEDVIAMPANNLSVLLRKC
ncbi:MAG: DUF938 domain-containing protein [Novosphingobium sp.]|nr:DUF938 domain-containing protein [Novosphingobium sp.]